MLSEDMGASPVLIVSVIQLDSQGIPFEGAVETAAAPRTAIDPV